MRLRKKEPKNWDFDFTCYENEEKKEVRVLNTKKLKRPYVSTRRAKFSPSMFELENITNIKLQISMKAIKVASYSQDIKDLWDMYGCLNEYWARIFDIFGSGAVDEIAKWQRFVVKKLLKAEKTGLIQYDVHRSLLRMRDKVYILANRANLGIQSEKIYGAGGRAKRGIEQ